MSAARVPSPLRSGDLIALVAPSRPAASAAVEDAVAYLQERGFRVLVSPRIDEYHYYVPSADRHKADELNRLFADPEVRCCLCARGGYGSGRLLDRIDYGAVQNNPKILVGFSDTAALQLALYCRSGLVSFTGALTDFDLAPERRDSLLESSLWQRLMVPEAAGRLPVAPDSLAVLSHGSAFGPLIPTNLALLCSLLGTPYFPSLRGAILLLEDVAEHPYRIDRMLNQLRLAGVLDEIAGLVLGQFSDCFTAEQMPHSPTLREMVSQLLVDRDIAIVAGFPYGHFPRRLVLPLGTLAELDTSGPWLSLVEPCLRPT